MDVSQLQSRLRDIVVDLEKIKWQSYGSNDLAIQIYEENIKLNEQLTNNKIDSEVKTKQMKLLHARLISNDKDMKRLDSLLFSQKEENGRLTEKCSNLSELLSKSESRQKTLEEKIDQLTLDHRKELERMAKCIPSIEKTNNLHNILVEHGKTDSNNKWFRYIRDKFEDDILHLKLCREMDAFSLKTLGSSITNELKELREQCKNVLNPIKNEFISRGNNIKNEITNLKSELSKISAKVNVVEGLNLEHNKELEHMEKCIPYIEKTNNMLNIFVEHGKTVSNITEWFKCIRDELEVDISHLKLCREIDAFSMKTLRSSITNELKEFREQCKKVLNEFKSRDNKFKDQITNLKFELSEISKVVETKNCDNQNHEKMISHGLSRKSFEGTSLMINVYEKFYCQLCDSTFLDLELLKTHIKEKEHATELNIYKCKLCGIENFNIKGLSFHCALSAPSMHIDSIARRISKNIPEKIACQPCYVTLNDVESLKLHFQVKEHASKLICTCRFCKVELSNIGAAISHLKSGNQITCGKIFFDVNNSILPKNLTL